MKLRWLLGIAFALAVVYFGTGACILHFGVERLLLPRTKSPTSPPAPRLQRIGQGGALFVRRYGAPRLGCVLFFPGHHGNLPAYRSSLFPAFTVQGIEVLDVAYPGQDGAPGHADFDALRAIAAQAISAASKVCQKHPLVVYGRSLGSMVAAYSAAAHPAAGLILEGAAPSLSVAVRRRLASHWYSSAWDALPVSWLLGQDFLLARALSAATSTPVVVFQGSADVETPLQALYKVSGLGSIRIIVVPGGTHSSTYELAKDRIVATAVSMLRQSAHLTTQSSGRQPATRVGAADFGR